MSSMNSVHAVPVTHFALAFGSLWVVYLCGRIIYNIYWHPLANFPGPKLHVATFVPFYWAVWLGIEPMSTKKLHDEYGPVVRVNPNTLSFITAQAWKDIHGYHSGRRQLPKNHVVHAERNPTQFISAIVGDADHARVRGLLSPAFSERSLREQESMIMGYVDLLIQRLKTQQGAVDLGRWYNFTTFDITGDLSLGQSFGSLESGDYHLWISNIFSGLKKLNNLLIITAYPILEAFFSCFVMLYPQALEGRRVHKEYAKVAVQKRLAMKTDKKDFMSYILQSKNEKGGLTIDELDANTELLLLAGSETSSTAIAGATYYLLTNKGALEKVCQEVRSVFQREDDITFASVARLPYLNAVIEETLRIYSPVPSSQRRFTLPEGNVIDGHFVPGNTKVGVTGWAAYLSSANFRSPEKFIPERWLDDPLYANDQRGACQPFALGPRNCIGKALAYAEMRSILARMLWNFDMELCEESRGWSEQRIYILWERPALMVKLTGRRYG